MAAKISIVLPCRNEKESIGGCLQEIGQILKEKNLAGEVIVSDSSADGSAEIAAAAGATVIRHGREGYGLAVREGVAAAANDVIVYADADGTYSFREIPNLLKELEENDLVVGSRLRGKIESGAMPLAHRFLGTPFLNFLLSLFFGVNISDSQSGYRALKRKTFKALNLKTNGMEFATEMLIKAKKNNLKIKEIPITYSRRKGNSKLRPYKDGFAHVKYILMQAPLAFYFTVGGILFLIGLFGHLFGGTATVKILFPFLGAQVFFLGLFAKTYLSTKFDEENKFIREFYSTFKLKTGLTVGLLLILIPILLKIFGLAADIFDPLLASTIIGLQIIFNSFILSSLSIK